MVGVDDSLLFSDVDVCIGCSPWTGKFVSWGVDIGMESFLSPLCSVVGRLASSGRKRSLPLVFKRGSGKAYEENRREARLGATPQPFDLLNLPDSF